MPRFQVTEHHKVRDAPPPAGDKSPTAPERPRPRKRRNGVLAGVAIAFVRLSLLLIGVALLVAGVNGMSSAIEYDGYRPVSDMKEIQVIVDAGYKTEYEIVVTTDPHGEDLAVRYSEDNSRAYVMVPSTQDGEPRYGMKLSVIRLDPELEPLVMFAPPEGTAQTATPSKDDGIRQDFEVFPFTTPGSYRLVFSGDDRGELRALMTVSGAATLGTIVRGEFDWVQIVAGVLLVALAAGGAFPLAVNNKRPDNDDEGEVEPDLLEHDEQRILDRADGHYARIGFARTSLTAEEENPETPDRLARAKGKGWVIRLD